MSTVAEIGSGGRRDLGSEAPVPARGRKRYRAMDIDSTRQLKNQIDDLRQDLELLLTAFRATRDLVYRLEAEVRSLSHRLEDHECTRRGVHGL